ncbi:MAG: hypothetical protein IPQ02_18475 [Saprospiraceae bacterium]|nr:hypothetical protein [Candidatus Defluviibacterium haderslevense]
MLLPDPTVLRIATPRISPGPKVIGLPFNPCLNVCVPSHAVAVSNTFPAYGSIRYL